MSNPSSYYRQHYNDLTIGANGLHRHLVSRMKPGSSERYDNGEEVLFGGLQSIAIDNLTRCDCTYEDYEELLNTGPGQNDPLFEWLAKEATLQEMKWFLTQEASGEAGFGDLIALTLPGMPTLPKLEMARNFWDEMGNGRMNNMHDLLLRNLVKYLDCDSSVDRITDEALTLSNYMMTVALNRRYAYFAVGALGVIEMTAPGRVTKVDEGLTRLEIPKEYRVYFKLHGTLDVKHSMDWNREVIKPLWSEHGTDIMVGAWIRLYLGSMCFEAYKRVLYT